MHLVETPQERNPMGKHMPLVERVIEQNDAQSDSHDRRTRHMLQKPGVHLLGAPRKPERHRGFHKLHHRAGKCRHPEVANVPAELVIPDRPEHFAPFPADQGCYPRANQQPPKHVRNGISAHIFYHAPAIHWLLDLLAVLCLTQHARPARESRLRIHPKK